MKLHTPNLAHPLVPNPPLNPSILKSPMNLPQPPSSYTDATPIYSPMTSDPPDHSSPVDTELENELDNFITLQQQLQHPNTLTIHHLSQTIPSSESSNSPSTTGETRAQRVFKRKLPNTPFPSNLRTAQTFMNHPPHINTKEFFQICSAFFPQYTYYDSNPNNEQSNYVNENAVFPTLSCTSYYHFSNPLSPHYIIVQTIMNYVKLGYIISLQHFTKNSSQLSD